MGEQIHHTFTVKSRPGFFFSIFFTKLLNKPGTSRIPFPTRWQAANARPAVVATVAMESVDALPAVASEQRQPNLRLSLAPKSRGGRSLQRKCASAAIQGSSSRLWIPVLVSYSVTVQ